MDRRQARELILAIPFEARRNFTLILHDPHRRSRVDGGRGNQPFSVRLPFFGPLIGSDVILPRIERDFEQHISLRSFVAVERLIRQPHARMQLLRQIVTGAVFEPVAQNGFGASRGGSVV